MADYGGNCGYVNIKGHSQMNIVPLQLRTEIMDQRINSAVYVKVVK